jgi:hypothetical protein
MGTRAKPAATTPRPVPRSAPEFQAGIVPHLSRPKRGPTCQLGYHHVFHRIFGVLSTGLPWQCLPVPKDPAGQPALHDTPVDPVFATWADEGSLWPACIARVRQLADQQPRDRSVRHGDGTNTVAKTGGRGSGMRGTHTRRARRSSRSRPTLGLSALPSPWLPSMTRLWGSCRRV